MQCFLFNDKRHYYIREQELTISQILLISSLISASTGSLDDSPDDVLLLGVHYGPTDCSQWERQESVGNDILDRRRGDNFTFNITNNLDKNISKSLTVSVQSSVIAKL